MAKRRQTTGQPNRSRQRAATQQNEGGSSSLIDNLLGNPKSRQEREDAINRLIIRSLTISGIVVAIIVGIALVFDQIIVPSQTVATVNGESISVREFRDRMGLEQVLVTNELNTIVQNAQAQADQFGIDVQQLLQNNQRYSQLLNEAQVADALALRVIDDMINDRLIAQEAATRNISVDEAQIDEEINQLFGYDPTAVALIGEPATETPTPTITPTAIVSPTPTPQPTATPIPEETAEATEEATVEATEDPFAALPTVAPSPTPSQDEVRENFEESVDTFRENVRNVGRVGDDVIDDLFRRQALQTALAEQLLREEPLNTYVDADELTATFVNVRHILLDEDSLEEAEAIVAALEDGASFAALARASSVDPGSGSNGGELGWSPAANYVAAFREAVLDESFPIGSIIGPVESQFGYHIIQVRAREQRDIEEAQLERIRDQLFSDWVEDLREANEANIEQTDDIFSYVN